jgi:hypothetical protein
MKASPQRGKREGEKNGKENLEEVEEARVHQVSFKQDLKWSGAPVSEIAHHTRTLWRVKSGCSRRAALFPFKSKLALAVNARVELGLLGRRK